MRASSANDTTSSNAQVEWGSYALVGAIAEVVLMKRAVFLFCVLGVGTIANAQIIWDESGNGDLSNDRFFPSNIALNSGTNRILASSGPNDLEYVHFHLGAGMQLDAIVPLAYAGSDQVAFIGVQAGSTFTEPASGTNVANLLGWALWGPGMGNMNTNILPVIGSGSGAQGFTGPLTGSDYTFWIQNTGSDFTWDMDFHTSIVPEPMSIACLAFGTFALLRRRNR